MRTRIQCPGHELEFDVAQEQQGLRADTYTYSLLMNGFAHARRPDMAFKLVSCQQGHAFCHMACCTQ